MLSEKQFYQHNTWITNNWSSQTVSCMSKNQHILWNVQNISKISRIFSRCAWYCLVFLWFLYRKRNNSWYFSMIRVSLLLSQCFFKVFLLQRRNDHLLRHNCNVCLFYFIQDRKVNFNMTQACCSIDCFD